jgi:uncharacterized repeat protein (TIGR01451 family)
VQGSTSATQPANVDTADVLTGFHRDCQNANLTVLDGHDDWSSISFSFFEVGDAAEGAEPPIPPDLVEPTLEELAEIAEARNATDLVLEKSGPAVVEAGSEFEYTLRVSNLGPAPAFRVDVRDQLPSEVGFVGTDGDCFEETTAEVVCAVGPVPSGEDASLTLTVDALGACQGGLPVGAITNVASVANLTQPLAPDVEPADNSAELTVEVVDTTAPEVFCNAPPTITPREGEDEDEPTAAPVSFTATARDACDDTVFVEVLDFDCIAVKGKQRVVDKTESCVVELAYDTITIRNTGGVGTQISWTVAAVDDTGNEALVECGVNVVRRTR